MTRCDTKHSLVTFGSIGAWMFLFFTQTSPEVKFTRSIAIAVTLLVHFINHEICFRPANLLTTFVRAIYLYCFLKV